MRFGIISTAEIGRESVIPAIQASDHEAAAIASRDADRAASVAADLGIGRSYGSYEALLEDDSLDAVYNPLPNGLHAEWTRRAADAGLDVLCEKPLTADAPAAADLFDYCADRDVTLMEAFMYRFHPRTERAVEVAADQLGDVRSVTSSFKFPLYGAPDDVRLDPDLAGGSIMDVGCYAISAVRQFLGDPDRALGSIYDTRDCGVDTEMAAVLEYDDGRRARVASGFDTQEVQRYRVDAVDGWLEAERAFNPDLGEVVTLEYEVEGRHAEERFEPVDQYRLEVEGFADAVESGSTPRVDRAETLGNMATIDAVYESADRGEAVDVTVPE
jgi:predicted dehydrogenase